jgi:type I restriction enzyme S subunit
MRSIGDVLKRVRRPVDVSAGETYREIGIRSHCKGIFHKPATTGEQIGEKRVFWVEPGCLVLNIVFAWEHAVAMTTDSEAGMIASHRFPMYASRNGNLLPEYAWRYFSSPRGKYDLGIASPGGAGRNKTLGQEEFNHLRIPVPPLAYQCRAVDALKSADRAIARTVDLIAAKRNLKKGLAQQMLTGRRRFAGCDDEWREARLADLVTILVSGVDKKSEPGETRVRLCNYTDVYYNDQIASNRDFMVATASDAEISRYSLKKWDVVITKDSETPDDIAKPAVVTEDMPGVLCGYHLSILRPKNVHGPFLAQLLRLSRTRYEFYRIANGVTRFGLGQHAIGGLLLKVPSNREQVRTAALLRAADRQVEVLESKLAALRQLKEGLMQRLLTDQVTARSG